MAWPTDNRSLRRAGAGLRRGLALLAATAVLWPTATLAQQPGDNPAAAETTIHGGWLVIAAYIVLWVGLMGYVGWLAWRQSQLDEELDELERRIDEELDV